MIYKNQLINGYDSSKVAKPNNFGLKLKYKVHILALIQTNTVANMNADGNYIYVVAEVETNHTGLVQYFAAFTKRSDAEAYKKEHHSEDEDVDIMTLKLHHSYDPAMFANLPSV